MVNQWKRSLSKQDVEDASAKNEVKRHDLRFIREMSRLFFDKSLEQLNYDDGFYEIFATANNVSKGSPAPIIQTGTNGYAFVGDGYQIQSATHNDNTFDPSISDIQGINWKPDGSKLYIIEDNTEAIHQYSASTPFDVSTLSADGKSLNLSNEENNWIGFVWKPDGTKLLATDHTNGQTFEYNLSTAWDISTASYTGNSFSPNEGDVADVEIKPDGTKIYFTEGGATQKAYEHDISTAWDITTANSSANSTYSFSQSPNSFVFDNDGSHFWIANNNGEIVEFSLSTNYDISNVSQTGDSLSFGLGNGNIEDFDWTQKGAGVSIIGGGGVLYGYSGASVETSGTAELSISSDLSFTPSSVVIEDTTRDDLVVDYEIEDSSSNTVTVTDSDVGSEIDTSTLSDGNLTITALMDSSGSNRLVDIGGYMI